MLTPEAPAALRRYRWPGNVRKLENAMERAVLLARDGKVGPAELPAQVSEGTSRLAAEPDVLSSLPYAQAKQSAMHAFETRYLGALMRKTEGNLSEAARLAGMDRSNFRRLLKANGIDSSGSVQAIAAAQDGEGRGRRSLGGKRPPDSREGRCALIGIRRHPLRSLAPVLHHGMWVHFRTPVK